MIKEIDRTGVRLKGYTVCVASGWGYNPEPFIQQVTEMVMQKDQEGWVLQGSLQVSVAACDDSDRFFVVTQTMIIPAPTRLPDSALDR